MFPGPEAGSIRILWRRAERIALFGFVLLLLIPEFPASLSAGKPEEPGTAAPPHNTPAATVSNSPYPTLHQVAQRQRGRRRRYGQSRPEPKRIREIQQALIKVGYLKGSPTGRWNTATRNAMKRFQKDNGFRVTGLPESKTLMKLGLGPHPLPPELDPTAKDDPAETPPPEKTSSPTSTRSDTASGSEN